MTEKLIKLLNWIEDVNVDIIDDEIVPGVGYDDFKIIRQRIEWIKSIEGTREYELFMEFVQDPRVQERYRG